MSSPAAPTQSQSQWFCHVCEHATAQPLRVPDLQCPRCGSDFMEEIALSDPRADRGDFEVPEDILEEDRREQQAAGPFPALLQGLMGLVAPPTNQPPQPQEAEETNGTERMPGGLPGGSHFSFTFSSMGPSGQMRTTTRHIGRPGTPQTSAPAPVRTLSDFLQDAFMTPAQQAQAQGQPQQPPAGTADRAAPPRGPPTNLAQMLLSMLGGQPTPGGLPGGFQYTFGAVRPGQGGQLPGQLGDFVFTQEGLDNVITRLMEQAGVANGPRPAPQDMIDSLPRKKLTEQDLALDEIQECAICQDMFAKDEEALRLPCKHHFHPDCILPWLQTSGTCPTCRYQLVEQPAHTPAAGGPGLGGFFGGGQQRAPQQQPQPRPEPEMDRLD